MPVPELSLTEEQIVRLFAEGLRKGAIADGESSNTLRT